MEREPRVLALALGSTYSSLPIAQLNGPEQFVGDGLSGVRILQDPHLNICPLDGRPRTDEYHCAHSGIEGWLEPSPERVLPS
jgi:hypothetical protein